MKPTTEKGHSFPSQKRAANVHGMSELIISPDVENLFLFQQSDSRKNEKEHKGSGSPRQSFLVAGPYRSNRSMTRTHAEIANSSKKDGEICPRHQKKGKNIFHGSDLQGNLDQLFLNGVSSHAVRYSHSDYVHNHSTNKKQKVNLEDNDLKYKQHVEPTIQSNRSFSLIGKMAVTTAEEDGSSFAFYQSLGSRKALDFKVNIPNNLSHTYPINYDEIISSPYLPKWRNKTDTRDNYNWKKHILHPNDGQAFSETVSGRIRNHGWKKHVNGQEKCKFLHSKCGETSGSTVNRLSYTQSHAETCELKLDKCNKDKCSRLYPEIRGSNSDRQQNGFSGNFSAGVSQIESDEVFARELQEKFYHETTRFMDMQKVDAKIARSLQTDEVAKAATLAWQCQSNPVLFEEFGNNLNNEVDLEMRLELLEAVEDMHENNYYDLELSQSFNDNNEMQTNIDESNHQHVGYYEINKFPLSIVQNGNNGETCPVCLDVPSVGETVCHLPCLHKFHQACIDAWLKRKPSCPVCKSKVA